MHRLLFLRVTLMVVGATLGTHIPPTIPSLSTGPSPAEAMHAPMEGYGATTTGGAGKPQCLVTTLADSGTGSLRECVSGGNRNVKFAIGGTITLQSPLAVGSSATIDGTTAPAPGITLTADTLRIWDASDIIVRGIRMRDVGFVGSLGSSGTVTREIDCIDVQGNSQRLVFDHVSVHNCGDGGIDIKAPAHDVTIQWSILSTWKQALWGSTDTSTGQSNPGRISAHHNAFICNDRPEGCDRNPLIRAGGSAFTVDLRRNIFEGWIGANGTKIEANAWVNVVDNAYIPRADTTLSQRAGSVKVNPGTRVFMAGNIELGAAPQPDLNSNGNEGTPMPAPPITGKNLGCVVRDVGPSPRDAVDRQLTAFLGAVPGGCADSASPPTSSSPPTVPTSPAPASASQPDLVPRLLSAPNTAMPGQALSVSATIANVGTASSPSSTARLYLSTDRTLRSDALVLGSIAVPELAQGVAHAATTNVSLPQGVVAGTYTLLVQADDGRTIAEASEVNNTMGIQIAVSAPSPSTPTSSLPSTPSSGDTAPSAFVPILINAESMTLSASMVRRSDRAALGGRYISPNGGGSSMSPVREASVSVTVPAAGGYYLWARMYGPSSTEDALYLGIGSSWTRAYPSTTRAYEWIRIPTGSGSGTFEFKLGAGIHSIQVGRGEANARLDAVYLTNNPRDVPTFAPGKVQSRR